MKLFLKKCAFFGLGLMVLNGLIFLIMDPVYSQKGYRHHFFKRVDEMQKMSLRTAVFSDSHGQALNNDMLNAAGIVNFSIGTDSYPDMLMKLRYLTHHRILNRVVLATDYHLFTQYRENINNQKDSKSLEYTVPVLSVIKRFVPLLNPYSRDIFLRIVTKEKDGRPRTPWQEMSGTQRLKSTEERVKKQFPTDILAKTQRDAFEQIVRLCKQEGFSVVGVRYPLADTYQNVMKQTGFDFNRVDRYIREAGIPNLDYLDHFSSEEDSDSYFKDQDHVNKKGSAVLTQLLAGDLSKY